MLFDQLLFVFYDPTNRTESGLPKIMRKISCRLVRPFEELLSDHSLPLGELVNSSMITMCVESDESGTFVKTFHICARCGAQMSHDECATCAPTVCLDRAFVGGVVVPEKMERFLTTLDHVFPVDPDIARGHERNKWLHREQAAVTFSVHRGGIPVFPGESVPAS